MVNTIPSTLFELGNTAVWVFPTYFVWCRHDRGLVKFWRVDPTPVAGFCSCRIWLRRWYFWLTRFGFIHSNSWWISTSPYVILLTIYKDTRYIWICTLRIEANESWSIASGCVRWLMSQRLLTPLASDWRRHWVMLVTVTDRRVHRFGCSPWCILSMQHSVQNPVE